MTIRICITSFCASLLLIGVSKALVIHVYDPDKHDRFINFTTDPSHNANFIHANLDLTGAGWYLNNTQRRGITMVSPAHFVGANHAKPSIGATVSFLSTAGELKTFTVASYANILNGSGDISDLVIGKLTTAIDDDDNINYHPYLNSFSSKITKNYHTSAIIMPHR